MKKLLLLTLVISSKLFSQSAQPDPFNCFNQQPYTKTTDPADNSPYVFTLGGFNYNLNPNGVNAPASTHFDWVNTQFYTVYAQTNSQGIVTAPATFISPFYCNGQSGNGNCNDNNTALYNSIKNDVSNQYFDPNPSIELKNKLKAMDILPEDGWELIKYSFGRAVDLSISPSDPGVAAPNPFIWLYNRYTGKMKLFVAISNVNLNTAVNPSAAVIKITTNPAGQYDLFANAKPFTHVFEDFNHTNDINSLTNCDVISMNAASQGLQYYWLYSEFTTSYDPCVCRQANSNNTFIRFDVILTQVSNVDLSVNGVLNPIYNGTNLIPDATSVNSFKADDNAGNTIGSQLITGAKETIKGYQDWKEYAEKIKNAFNSATSNGNTPPSDPKFLNIVTTVAASYGQNAQSLQTKFVYDKINANPTNADPNPEPTSKFIQKLAGLAPLVEDLASATPYIGAFIALTNFLADAGTNDQTQSTSQPAAPPTAYALDAKIKGTIVISSPGPTGQVSIPGEYLNKDFSIPGQKNADQSFPIYNNPLGVFNIIEVPNFKYKEIPMTNNGIDPNDPNYQLYNFSNGSYEYFQDLANDISNDNYCVGSAGFPNTVPVAGKKPFEGVYDYKLSGNVKYVLNPASNLSVKSIDACYVIEYNGNDALITRNNTTIGFGKFAAGSGHVCKSPNLSGRANANGFIGDKQIPYYPYSGFEYSEYSPSSDNFNSQLSLNDVINKLKNEGFEVEEKTSGFVDLYANNGSNSVDEKFRIRTKYVPLQSLPDIDFILMGAKNNPPKVYLKLFCKFTKNNAPSSEPVTMVLTYDISTRLTNAINDGTGGGGNYYSYFAKDIGGPAGNYLTPKPGDYCHFGGLNVFGAYYSPNYSSQGPLNINSAGNGGLSAGDINVSNGTFLINPSSTGFITYAATTDLNIGNDVEIVSAPGSGQIVNIRAGNNINIGQGLDTRGMPPNSSVTYYAGNNISISDAFFIGIQPSNQLEMYAGNRIDLTQSSAYLNTYNYGTKAFIINSSLYAKNEINLTVGPAGDDIVVVESVLSTKQNIPNPWVVLHNGNDAAVSVSALQATNSDISGKCTSQVINERVLANASDPNSKSIYGSPKVVNQKQISSLDAFDYKIGVYPNPTTGNLNINFFSPVSANNISITVEDIAGKLLYVQNANVNAGYSSNQLSLQDYVNGIYIIKIADANGNVVKTDKVILNR